MKIVKGDLLELAKNGQFDVIVHGCNCFCTMGAGIALQIKHQFPEAYKADMETKNSNPDYITKLGTYSKAEIGDLTIVNAYTQFYPGINPLSENYDAIVKVFVEIANDFSGKRVGIPMIGAGLAGGNWAVINKIIENAVGGLDITVVEYCK